jgi:hypothetical protein
LGEKLNTLPAPMMIHTASIAKRRLIRNPSQNPEMKYKKRVNKISFHLIRKVEMKKLAPRKESAEIRNILQPRLAMGKKLVSEAYKRRCDPNKIPTATSANIIIMETVMWWVILDLISYLNIFYFNFSRKNRSLKKNAR